MVYHIVLIAMLEKKDNQLLVRLTQRKGTKKMYSTKDDKQ